jgi:hypothetical protein
MNRCPKCGGELVLAEAGTYGGSRKILGDGRIVPDTFHEEWTECDMLFLHCIGGCGYDNRYVEVRDERVTIYDPMQRDG